MTLLNGNLYAVIKSTGRKPSHVICEYKLSDLEKTFEITWSLCQNTENNKKEVNKENVFLTKKIQVCQLAENENEMENQCYIYSWKKQIRFPLCERFNKGAFDKSKKWDNCDLASSNTSADRNGWLENFKPVMGQVVAKYVI